MLLVKSVVGILLCDSEFSCLRFLPDSDSVEITWLFKDPYQFGLDVLELNFALHRPQYFRSNWRKHEIQRR